MSNKLFFLGVFHGETSAGKTSMINLLLNDRVLPTRIMKNTLTICEISYGPCKEAVVHFAKSELQPLKLKDNTFDEIKQYIEKPRNDEQWCKKIEIKIPNPLLQDGIVIVDSPGIGDLEDVSNIAMEYLPQALAFIYVINSPNAGGLQKDRLLRIVKEWIKLYREENHKPITAESALFVCNKWDDVERNASYDQRKEDDLQKHIISELKNKIPDLDEESQVIKMSVNTATQVQQKFNVMSDDLNSLVDGIQRLLSLCIEKKTEQFYRWISGYFTSLLDQVKSKMKNAKRSREERLKARKDIDEKLKEFKQEASIRNAEEALSNHVKRISERTKSYLQSDDVRRAFCKWTEKDLPHVDDDRRGSEVGLKKIYNECMEQRLEMFLEKLENKEKLFAKAHAELQELFHKSFFNFEKDIRNIDQVLVGEAMDEVKNYSGKLFPPLDERVKKFLVLTSASFMPVLFPSGLAAGVLSAPVFEYLADGNNLKKQDLDTNACQTLTELSTEFLQAFIKHEVANLVKRELTDENIRISSIRRCHQELIDKYEKRCKDLSKSEDEAMTNQTVEKLHALCKTLQDRKEKLMFDAIQHGIQVMYPPCQIDERRLQYAETSGNKLGEGSYGEVYKGKFRLPGRRKKIVAVKNLKEAPEPSNVASFLREAAMLMQLRHKYIVRFYGVAMKVDNHELISLSLVFKLYIASLKDHIFNNGKCIPWKTARAMAVTCQWSMQILDALEFIHSKNIVHRDLKLDNVLISRRDHIKITDLGLATFKTSITGTVCGTPLYFAPEVGQSKVYDSKVDIYSFGIMMWEMWFGKRAAKNLSLKSANEVIQQIENDKRRGEGPFNPPPTKWIELMASCWNSNPCLRPTAAKSKDFIEELKRDF